jgi:hypothetical protein
MAENYVLTMGMLGQLPTLRYLIILAHTVRILSGFLHYCLNMCSR